MSRLRADREALNQTEMEALAPFESRGRFSHNLTLLRLQQNRTIEPYRASLFTHFLAWRDLQKVSDYDLYEQHINSLYRNLLACMSSYVKARRSEHTQLLDFTRDYCLRSAV